MPAREIYWNIAGAAWIYAFAAVAIGVLAFGVQRRVRLWRLGRAESRLDRPWERVWGLLIEVLGQRRGLRERFPGVAHLLIFYGFMAALVATSLIAIQEWTGIHFLQGRVYLWYSLLSDVLGLLAIVGLCMAIWRRTVRRPSHLHSAFDDWLALGLLLLLFVQGFAIEGLRIAVTELRQDPALALWSPGGYGVARLVQGLPADVLRGLHRVLWWVHAITAFVFLGYLFFGKLAHAGFGALNILLRNLEPTGKLSYPDIEATIDADPDALATLGVDRIDGYSWKSLLDLDSCMNCGRCESVCPAHLSGVALSPRKLILSMRDHLSQVGPAASDPATGPAGGEAGAHPPTLPTLFGEAGGPASAVLEEELWGCRTCGACTEECPVYIEHVPKMIDMRRYLVMNEAKMSDETRAMLKNIDERMHPWVGVQRDRREWFKDLDVPVLSEGHRPEYLFWVGCAGAMTDRGVETSRALVRILRHAGVDFGVLGEEEVCTGDPARRVGGELTFQTCAKKNIETLARYGVEKIVTSCPHCFNTFGNEYGDFGGRYQVLHHTQLIQQLLEQDRLRVRPGLESVTYHDPCYLGRHNGEYDAPREILARLSRRGAFRELPRNRSRALCCGAGGGYAFMDDNPKLRINHMRVAEAKDSGAAITAVACPFCTQMFDDGLGALDPDRTMRVANIAELVSESLED